MMDRRILTVFLASTLLGSAGVWSGARAEEQCIPSLDSQCQPPSNDPQPRTSGSEPGYINTESGGMAPDMGAAPAAPAPAMALPPPPAPDPAGEPAPEPPKTDGSGQ